MTEDDERLYRQTVEVHAAVSKRLSCDLWEGLPVINEVKRDAAYLGTMTALIHHALFVNALWAALANLEDGREFMDAEEDRTAFLELVADCYDDADAAAERSLEDKSLPPD